MVKAVLSSSQTASVPSGCFSSVATSDMADLNRAHFPFDRHIANDAHRLLATQVNHRIRHRGIIIHLARDPVAVAATLSGRVDASHVQSLLSPSA